MAFLASTSRTSFSRGSNAALLLGVFAFFGCNDVNGSGAPEDKDGVTEVPTPNGNNSVGTGLVGGGGSSGTGGGVNGQDCLGDPDCDDDDLCTIEFCNPDVNKCVQFDAAEDDNICTMDSCDPRTGTIQNIATPIVDNVCTYDLCDPVTGPSNLPYSTLFAEDFTSNAAGWSLGPQWFIGSAAASSGGKNGANDPISDHSDEGDGVAGTAQGALVAPQAVISPLTSPSINVSSVQPEEFVTLVFWRWLAGDAPADMGASITATVGANSYPIWDNAAGVVNDAPPLGTGWFEIRHDLTAAAADALATGNSLRLVFSFSKTATLPSVGGWNIDDLEVRRTLTPADNDICTRDECEPLNDAPVPDYDPITSIDDGDPDTVFACVPGIGPQQQPTAP